MPQTFADSIFAHGDSNIQFFTQIHSPTVIYDCVSKVNFFGENVPSGHKLIKPERVSDSLSHFTLDQHWSSRAYKYQFAYELVIHSYIDIRHLR